MFELLYRIIRVSSYWKPEWLYEQMPFVYIGSGFVTLLLFKSMAGYVAGTSLILAALLAWKMRRENRYR
jgi:hypothetical protein